jgi:high affinity Mn2+ porin
MSTILILGVSYQLIADNGTDSIGRIHLHFQQTVVSQYHFDFPANYTGPNSLQPSESIKTSLTSTLYLAYQPFKNATIVFNPEVAGGEGLSSAKGVAGFTNGETFRIGNPAPKVYVARILVEFKIPLTDKREWQEDDVNQLPGYVPEKYLNIVAGRFAISDYFDCNSYSHDPRSQFLNWSLMSNGAYDYAANTRGYTWGFVAEYISSTWGARIGAVMVPTEANLSVMDGNIKDAHALQLEVERKFGRKEREAVIRVLVYQNSAHMGNYKEAVSLMPVNPDITTTRAYGRT